jgi:Tfp pilus assembly protein PilX
MARLRLHTLVRGEHGMILPVALGMMAVLTIAVAAMLLSTSANERSSDYSEAEAKSFSVAEGGLAQAFSILSNSSTPLDPSLFPPSTVTIDAGDATYQGTLAGNTWTLTSTGVLRNPSGGAPVTRTVTRTAQVVATTGATPELWNRIYADDVTSACGLTIRNTTITAPVAARGNLCLRGTGSVTGSPVDVGGKVTLETSSSIGTSGTPIAEANIAGTCTWASQPAHTPCSAGDHVYASQITTSPENLTKPLVDFAYWYQNAMPGPMHNCTTGSLPGGFDSNTTYDGGRPALELTPPASSYTCEVRDGGGSLVGELSWNHATHVLKITGTIFIDGDVDMDDDGAVVDYNGQATLYVAKRWFGKEVICAGGNGSNNCRAAGTMDSWSPATNLLVIIAGGKTTSGLDVNMHNDGALQGALFSNHDCRLDNDFHISGPIICNNNFLGRGGGGIPSFSWPTVPLLDGQIYASGGTGVYQIVPGPQNG